jgi:hypothetical protein
MSDELLRIVSVRLLQRLRMTRRMWLKLWRLLRWCYGGEAWARILGAIDRSVAVQLLWQMLLVVPEWVKVGLFEDEIGISLG